MSTGFIPLYIPAAADHDEQTRIALAVDGVAQPDRVGFRGLQRPPLPLGFGMFGAGVFGQGAAVVDQPSIRAFESGFRRLALTATDAAGNVSEPSPEVACLHRPAPAPPERLSMEGTTLTWRHDGL